ncbi:hypothetical protein A2Y99_01830 [Candidatus Gottesmanbacteria bacterium RBG_13_37_7]|uniref:FecR protein domain-containing protein n=1 Tax=Candidatus Gottesmanbacteria bacterium RBG_13_37_7 TaxID=1798369 RepID=A0A1F5YK60_9BACT|nr:MAG: hypothetical protein A2Y99_01830 [Candidatus Gottesmanbacteria bacterium RBG_13_37_7]
MNDKNDKKYKKLFILVSIFFIALLGFTIGLLNNRFSYKNQIASLTGIVSQYITNLNTEDKYQLKGIVALKEGTVEVKSNFPIYLPVAKGTTVSEGNYIKTGPESRTVIEFDDGSAIRLGENSEVRLSNLGDELILLTQYEGSVYHRVQKGNVIYNVKSLNTLATAMGTQFTVATDVIEKKTDVIVFENQVEVSIKGEENPKQRLLSGEKTSIALETKTVDVLPQTEEDKNTDFVKWNKELNENIKPEKSENISPKVIPTTKVVIEPTTAINGKVYLSGNIDNDKVNLGWTLTGTAPYGYKLLHSAKPEPVFPLREGDQMQYFSSSETKSYSWEDLAKGMTHHFRIGIYDGIGNIISYSNNVSITIPAEEKKQEPTKTTLPTSKTIAPTSKSTTEKTTAATATEISVSAVSNETGKAVVEWTVNGSVQSGFKICAGKNINPSYPLDNCVFQSPEIRRYIFELPSGETYHIRAGIYVGGETKISTYSNDIEVKVK